MTIMSSDFSGVAKTHSIRGAFHARLAAARRRIARYFEQRAIYHRTLRELHSYSRRDLLDLGIDPDNLHGLARRAAGR